MRDSLLPDGEKIMNNWLEIGVAVFFISMILYGHYKGFLRLAVSMVALIATLVIVSITMPVVSGFMKNHTPIFTWIENGVESAFGMSPETETEQMPAQQRVEIERMKLPQEIKDVLIENNNRDVYLALGVDRFTDYIGNYLANIVLNVLGFILMFIIVYFLIRVLTHWLGLIAKLPILSGLNQLAGAVLGAVEGLFYLWIACLVLTACAGMGWASSIIAQIEASPWLSYLYHYNVVSRLLFYIIRGILL